MFKDLFSAYGTAGALTSLGVMGGVVAFLAMGVNIWFGPDTVPTADVDSVKTLVTDIGAKVVALVGILTAIYGRIRAKKTIGGEPLK